MKKYGFQGLVAFIVMIGMPLAAQSGPSSQQLAQNAGPATSRAHRPQPPMTREQAIGQCMRDPQCRGLLDAARSGKLRPPAQSRSNSAPRPTFGPPQPFANRRPRAPFTVEQALGQCMRDPQCKRQLEAAKKAKGRRSGLVLPNVFSSFAKLNPLGISPARAQTNVDLSFSGGNYWRATSGNAYGWVMAVSLSHFDKFLRLNGAYEIKSYYSGDSVNAAGNREHLWIDLQVPPGVYLLSLVGSCYRTFSWKLWHGQDAGGGSVGATLLMASNPIACGSTSVNFSQSSIITVSKSREIFFYSVEGSGLVDFDWVRLYKLY